MKTHIHNDPGLHLNPRLTPRGRRILLALIIAAVAIAVALALTDRTEAAGNEPDACYKWQTTCTSYRYVLGIRICTAWRTTCLGAPTAQRVAGLASYTFGQGGKCTRANEWRGLQCTVADAGPGWVYGDCAYGLSFNAETMRTFTPGQLITIRGCKNQYGNITNAKISR